MKYIPLPILYALLLITGAAFMYVTWFKPIKVPAPVIIHDTIIRTDTVFVHDSIYMTKQYGNVGTVNIGN